MWDITYKYKWSQYSNQMVQEILLGLEKNLNNQTRSGRPKTMDFKAIPQGIEENLVIITQRVPGKLSISQSSVVHHFHDLSKSIKN